jgi:hypothetical protein
MQNTKTNQVKRALLQLVNDKKIKVGSQLINGLEIDCTRDGNGLILEVRQNVSRVSRYRVINNEVHFMGFSGK